MPHQASHLEHATLLAAARGPAQPGPPGGLASVPGHSHIQVQVHPAARPPLALAASMTTLEVPEAGHGQVDARGERRPEVGIHRVEPAQHRGSQPGFPQRQAFGDAGHPQPGRPVVQRRAGGFGTAVPETVRFHDGHHLSAGTGGEEPGVGRDRKQVNGEDGAPRAAGVSCGRRRSGHAHPATRSVASPEAHRALVSRISATVRPRCRRSVLRLSRARHKRAICRSRASYPGTLSAGPQLRNVTPSSPGRLPRAQ